jgi:ABC-type transporter Mla MlaB component
MLRAKLDQSGECLALRLEGQIVSAWAVQVKAHVARHFVTNGLLVDLSEVTYVDSTGEQLLLWLRDLHARFVAGTCYARDICERLHLNHRGDTDGSVPSVTVVHPPPAPRPARAISTGPPGAAPLQETSNRSCLIVTKLKLEKICSE